MPANVLPIHSPTSLDEAQRLRTVPLGPPGRTRPWHPKLTPYRLAILSTTFTLGTAKAIATQQGINWVSTTLEWVGGTILSVIFFCLGTYESNERVPVWLHWLFKTDCMDLLWSLLASIFSFQRPDYWSDEISEPPKFVPIAVTSYRMMVSVTVFMFGVSKAVMGYCGLSSSVTWVDWAIGTPISCIFYIMSLYENHPGAGWSAFFWVDRSSTVKLVNFRLFIFIAAFGWIALTSKLIHRVSLWDLGLSQSLEVDTQTTTTMNSWAKLFTGWLGPCLKVLFLEFLLAGVGIGVLPLYLLFYSMFLDLLTFPTFSQRISHVLQHPAAIKCWSAIKFTSRVVAHLCLHLYALTFVLTLSVICLGTSPYLFEQGWDFTLLITGPLMIFVHLLLLVVAIGITVSMIIYLPR